MALPPSFARDGFVGAPKVKHRGLLIGTEGAANTGKTEFAMSAPGPIIGLALDRSYRQTMENPEPPDSRRTDVLWQPIKVLMPTACQQKEALEGWNTFYGFYKRALENPDVRSVILDGDSDSFELQMLAEFGRTAQIPQIQRTSLNASRRAMIARAHDSGKVVICTNKLKKKYETQYNADGSPKMADGKEVREWDGVSYERQGFNDHTYLFEIQLRHVYEEGQWGAQLLMVKANRKLEGEILWGDMCNLQTLLELVYPTVPLSEWGY